MVFSLLAMNDHANPLDPLHETCKKSLETSGIDGEAQQLYILEQEKCMGTGMVSHVSVESR